MKAVSDRAPTREYQAIADRIKRFPQLRFMGSKYRLLPWIHDVLSEYRFESVIDAFSGSGCVSYLLKCMGKRVVSNDFLNFCATIAKATIENSRYRISSHDLRLLLSEDGNKETFITDTFDGIFFTRGDLSFLDRVSGNLEKINNPYIRSLAVSALLRSCVKRQPRGVFTVAGDPAKYKDGRRDVNLSLREHFLEQVQVYNGTVFDNSKKNLSFRSDVFALGKHSGDIDLVYLDPPYIPRSDDNCYIKRYHFLEGLSCYWRDQEILEHSKVKKIKKKHTPFSYRSNAIPAFRSLFQLFQNSIIVLSYSSNGFPDLQILIDLLRESKRSIRVFEHDHRYHFGTHAAVKRAIVTEYLIVGTK